MCCHCIGQCCGQHLWKQLFVSPEIDGSSSVTCFCTAKDSNGIGDVFGDTLVATDNWREVARHGDSFGEVGQESGLSDVGKCVRS